MPHFPIQPATSADREAWAQLRYELWPHCPPLRHLLEIEQLLAGPGIVALAFSNDRPIGFVEISIRRDHVEGATALPVPYLEGWFVQPAFRHQGAGRALMAFAEQWARAQGHRELASDAELINRHSIGLHTQLGFRETGRSVHFVKSLP